MEKVLKSCAFFLVFEGLVGFKQMRLKFVWSDCYLRWLFRRILLSEGSDAKLVIVLYYWILQIVAARQLFASIFVSVKVY